MGGRVGAVQGGPGAGGRVVGREADAAGLRASDNRLPGDAAAASVVLSPADAGAGAGHTLQSGVLILVTRWILSQNS